MAAGVPRDFVGRALGDQLATAGTGLRPEVEDPVGRLDHLEIVLDDDHGVAQVGQTVNHFQQVLDVVEVQSRGRLVEDVKGLARVRSR